MTAGTGLEELEVTRAEKVLAVVLAAFLLLGGLWVYFKVNDAVPAPEPYERVVAEHPTEATAIRRLDRASAAVFTAQGRRAQSARALVQSREAYRTALDAGEPAEALRRAYVAAQSRAEGAERALERATRAERAAASPADRARTVIDRELERQADRHALVTFAVRLGYVAAAIFLAFWALGRLRRRSSRYFIVGLSLVGFATAQAVVMAGDYATDYLDVLELGPIILSVIGVALTLGALVALQRFLARRLPERRVRKRQCPFCGYPVGGNRRCEGCGRAVIAGCAACEADRRTGTRHCGACGAA